MTPRPWYLKQESALEYCKSPVLATERIVWPTIRDLCSPIEGKNVIDIASGEGHIARKLKVLGATCTGIDISPTMIKIASERSEQEGIPIEYLELDAENLEGIGNGTYDIALINFLFCNISSREKLSAICREAYRVTKPNGHVIVPVQNSFLTTLFQQTGRENPLVSYESCPSNYFASGDKMTCSLKLSNGDTLRITNYYWSLEDHVLSLLDAGFVIDALREPRPSKEVRSESEDFRVAFEIPLYTIIRGRKQ